MLTQFATSPSLKKNHPEYLKTFFHWTSYLSLLSITLNEFGFKRHIFFNHFELFRMCDQGYSLTAFFEQNTEFLYYYILTYCALYI